uniref:TBC1 domain family, member 15 n=1 Tax=Salmo trutta TaxID=8032 RepID=A0A673X429_SALTR
RGESIPFPQDSSSVMEWAQCPGEERSTPQQAVVEQQQSYETEWDMINAVSFPKRKPCSNGEGALNHTHEKSKWAFTFSVWDLRSITVKEKGSSRLMFRLKEPPTSLPVLHFHQGGSEDFLDCLRRYALITDTYIYKGKKNVNFCRHKTCFPLQKLKNDPYVTTLGGFSKVTNYIFDAFRGPELEQQQRPPEEMADLDILGLGEVIPGLEINQQEEPGFEVITRIDLGARPEVTRRQPLSAEDWAEHQEKGGRMKNVPHLKEIIFKGGLCHAVRKEAWKFLLGYYPWDSTYEERKGLQRRKTDEYFRMKLQWKSVSEEQERRNSRLRDFRSLIEKDVNRTDRTNRFYEGMDNPGLVLLHDILMTYCMYDFDLGYVQGMSDLLSPILYVMENEVDAFWCFVSFMDHMVRNVALFCLVLFLCVCSQDSGYLYFCFRWLLIRFKRELSYPDVLRMWEVMWTGLPCQNFHLLVCCAILDSEKRKIMEENYGFNEILKHINELSMKLDIEEILHKSEAFCMQIRSCKDLPHSIIEILGFNTESELPRLQGQEFGTLDSPQSPRPTQRQEVFSNGHNGHYREPLQNGCKVTFIS